jgi:hypothetical protein
MAIVNHDYPNIGDFIVVNDQNEPIEGAEVRIYESVPFQAGILDSWVGSTTTDIDGRWVDPIVIPDGGSWVVYIQKYSLYGPKHYELIT